MHIMPRAAAILLFATTVTACEKSPIAPQPPADPLEAALVMADGQAYDYQPLLPRLFRAALARIARTEGREVAKGIADEVERLHQAASAAQAAGDLELAQRFLEQAKLEMAEAIVHAFGTNTVDRVLSFAHDRLEALGARIRALEARGIEVPSRVIEIAQAVGSLLAEARAEYASGHAPKALVLGAEAVNLLARIWG